MSRGLTPKIDNWRGRSSGYEKGSLEIGREAVNFPGEFVARLLRIVQTRENSQYPAL